MSGAAPRIFAEIPAPASVVGPPPSVAVAPDDSFALVTGAMKLDPADPTKMVRRRQADRDRPEILAAKGAGDVAGGARRRRRFDQPCGTLALVANRNEGTVSVFTISGNTLTPAGKISLGDAKSGPSHAIFSRDGATRWSPRDGDSKISVLAVDGGKVEYTKRDLVRRLRPYQIDIAGSGDVAVVGNVGAGAATAISSA